jgi:hypothetical protein
METDDYNDFTSEEQYQSSMDENDSFVDESISAYSTYDQRANKIKFLIYSLVYCMYEDDNEFTRKEKRMFKMISRVVSMNLQDRDVNEVKSFMDVRPSLDDIVRMQQKYNLDIQDVVDTINSLKQHLKGNDQYRPILDRIEKRFQYEL